MSSNGYHFHNVRAFSKKNNDDFDLRSCENQHSISIWKNLFCVCCPLSKKFWTNFSYLHSKSMIYFLDKQIEVCRSTTRSLKILVRVRARRIESTVRMHRLKKKWKLVELEKNWTMDQSVGCCYSMANKRLETNYCCLNSRIAVDYLNWSIGIICTRRFHLGKNKMWIHEIVRQLSCRMDWLMSRSIWKLYMRRRKKQDSSWFSSCQSESSLKYLPHRTYHSVKL